MLGLDKQREAARSIFISSAKGFANMAAIIAAYLATGPIHAGTVGWINSYTATHYGTGWDDLISFAWFGIVACTAFFVARASIATLIVLGGFALATRFF